MVTAIAGAGTPEEAWRSWPAPAAWPELVFASAPPRVVVVAPHPDDEVLGVGGTLALLAAAGCEVVVVAVTDGEASHPGSPTLSRPELAARRALERSAALRHLGLGSTQVRRLGLADGGVTAVEPDLAAALTELLAPSDWCLTTWSGDGHPDHEATGRAALRAAASVGCRVLEFPVWTWHWAEPADDRVPWSRARRVSLPPAVETAKRAAVAEYRTQVEPLSDSAEDAAILPPPTLRRLLRNVETVFI